MTKSKNILVSCLVCAALALSGITMLFTAQKAYAEDAALEENTILETGGITPLGITPSQTDFFFKVLFNNEGEYGNAPEHLANNKNRLLINGTPLGEIDGSGIWYDTASGDKTNSLGFYIPFTKDGEVYNSAIKNDGKDIVTFLPGFLAGKSGGGTLLSLKPPVPTALTATAEF